MNLLYGTAQTQRVFWASAPPLFLEDENIFQKSASMVQILSQFPIVLWLYDIMHYTTSSFGAAEPFAPDQGFEIDPDVV